MPRIPVPARSGRAPSSIRSRAARVRTGRSSVTASWRTGCSPRCRWTGAPAPKTTCRRRRSIRIANLYELACRLAAARVYIGNDSGIAHLAAAVGTPVVVLFGPTDPLVWAPRGDNVRVVRAAEMAAIPLAEVLAATLK